MDLRLMEATRRIDSGSVKLLSLDIFDTLLWRKVPLPADLFLLLGQQFKQEGWLIEGITPECFAELRSKAEVLARAKKAKDLGQLSEFEFPAHEVTLKEIYWSLTGIFNKISIEQLIQGKKGIINESDIDDLVAIELALEQKLTEFDVNILQLITYAHSKSIPIILVSNTYFEHTQLRKLIDRPVLQTNQTLLSFIREVYPSCEMGCGKARGLFKKILEKIQIAPHEMLHIGDDATNDYLAAKGEKIEAIHYEKSNKHLEEILKREWPERNSVARRECLDPEQGDFGLTALRSKIANHKALDGVPEKDAFFWKYGATVLGPILVGFTHWIYQRCQALGQTQVFCLMREGELYAELIQRCASCYPKFSIEAKKLWASRHFMMQASIFHGDLDELMGVYITNSFSTYDVETFCIAIGIKLSQIKPFAKYRYVTLLDVSLRKKLIAYIINNPLLKEHVIEVSKEKRRNFLKHLSSLVDLNTLSQMILIDMGWIGTIQGALQRILAKEGYAIQVHGLYIGTVDKNHYALLQGFIREGYLLKAGCPQEYAQTLLRSCYALEQCAICDLQPLINFDTEGQLIQGQNTIHRRQIHQICQMREGLYTFCKQLNGYINNQSIQWNAFSEPLVKQLLNILVRSTSYLTKQEADKLGVWGHDFSSRENTVRVISSDAYYQSYIGDIVPGFSFKQDDIPWLAAITAKFDKNLARASQAVLMKKLPQKCFLSKDFIPLNVFIDTGNGFSKKPIKKLELHSTANRRFFGTVSLDSLKKNILKIRLELVCPEMLVRIKSLRLTVGRFSTPKPETLIFCESKENPQLTSSVEQLDFNTFVTKKENLVLIHSFDHQDIYEVKIKLCFEVFEMRAPV